MTGAALVIEAAGRLVAPAVAGDCLLWQGALDVKGYGRVKRDGHRLAHRYAWALVNGPIPAGTTVDHLCFTRRCVNPDHLRLLSHNENAANQRQVASPTCRNGHVRTPESVAHRIDFRGKPLRRCRECEREANRRAWNKRTESKK